MPKKPTIGESASDSLGHRSPRRHYWIVLLFLADANFFTGLSLPIVKLSRMAGLAGCSYSIIQSVQDLKKSGLWGLAVSFSADYQAGI